MKILDQRKWAHWLTPLWAKCKPALALLALGFFLSFDIWASAPPSDSLDDVPISTASTSVTESDSQQHDGQLLDLHFAGIPAESFNDNVSLSRAASAERMTLRETRSSTSATGPPDYSLAGFAFLGCLGIKRKNQKERKRMKQILRPALLVLLPLLLAFSSATAAPINDNFANATVISSGLPVSVSGSNVGATAQAGEPSHSDSEPRGGRSVWWSWTSPVTGSVVISTFGSGSTDGGADPYLDTQVGVYTGSSVSALTVVAKKEDSDGAYAHGWTRLVINVTAGTVYKIAVDGWQAHEGRIALSINAGSSEPPPPPAQYKLTLNAIPSGAGTVTASPEQPVGGYDAGTVVTITATGENFSSWSGAASGSSSSVQVTMNGNKTVNAIFGSDRQVVFQNLNNRTLSVWMMNGTTNIASTLLRNGTGVAPGWKAVTMADFDGNGTKDILFQNTGGKMAIWRMDGMSYLGAVNVRNGQSAGTGWKAIGAGDLNGDNSVDIVFQNTNGKLAAWFMNGTTFVSSSMLRGGQAPASGTKAIGVIDLNNDTKADILLQSSTGVVSVWFMNGAAYVSSKNLRNGQAASQGWRLCGFADFNNDTHADFLWQHQDSRMAVWRMNGTNYLGVTSLRNGTPVGQQWFCAGAN